MTIQRYAKFDSAGKFAFELMGGDEPTIPADFTKVTEAQWQALSSDPNSYRYDTNSKTVVAVTLTTAEKLADAQTAKISELTNACQTAIVGGYSSSALGSAHTYPSKPTDQANMTASVLSSLLPGVSSTWETMFWCADSSGNWAYVSHTASQIQQAGSDGKTFIQSQQAKLEGLKQQVAAATTVAAVQAITW